MAEKVWRMGYGDTIGGSALQGPGGSKTTSIPTSRKNRCWDISTWQKAEGSQEGGRKGAVPILELVRAEARECDTQKWDCGNRDSNAGTRSDLRRPEKRMSIVLNE